VEVAFETRAIFNCSTRELEECLGAIAAEKIPDPTSRAHASAMSQTIRELLARQRLDRTLHRRSRFSRAAFAIALIALFCSIAQLYYFWLPFLRETTTRNEFVDSNLSEVEKSDPRTQLTLWELARFGPTIRKGSLQGWWAGEQARKVLVLEAEAKHELLAGDREGAARTIARADAIRAEIPTLANFEKPTAH
jgi:hypothetical protein